MTGNPFTQMRLPSFESSSLGYALWPEQSEGHVMNTNESSSLGYALWPELIGLHERGMVAV